jgi:hypothetical protein
MNAELLEALNRIDMLEKALFLIANTDGDYTQGIVYDALYEVGYYTDEEFNEGR